jgi:hypothetical protein
MKNRLPEWRERLRGYRAHDPVEENSGFIELRGFRMEELIAAQIAVERALHAFIHILPAPFVGLRVYTRETTGKHRIVTSYIKNAWTLVIFGISKESPFLTSP